MMVVFTMMGMSTAGAVYPDVPPVDPNVPPKGIGESIAWSYEKSNPVAPIVEQKVQPKPKAQTTDTNPAVLALLGVALVVGIGRKIIKKH